MEAAGGKALPCVVDIRDEQQIGAAVQKAVDTFGGKRFSSDVTVPVLTSSQLCVIGRYRHPGEQCQRHQSDGNSGDSHEEGGPNAGNQSEGNVPDVRPRVLLSTHVLPGYKLLRTVQTHTEHVQKAAS